MAIVVPARSQQQCVTADLVLLCMLGFEGRDPSANGISEINFKYIKIVIIIVKRLRPQHPWTSMRR